MWLPSPSLTKPKPNGNKNAKIQSKRIKKSLKITSNKYKRVSLGEALLFMINRHRIYDKFKTLSGYMLIALRATLWYNEIKKLFRGET